MWNKLFLLHGTIGDFCLLLALCNMVLAKKKSVVFWKKNLSFAYWPDVCIIWIKISETSGCKKVIVNLAIARAIFLWNG
jgi:hypothetical protein